MKYTVLDYFEETVTKYSDKEAFSDIDKSITFGGLKTEARKFGTAVMQKCDEADVVVFYLEKCVDTIIGFLGSVYAGKAYTQINLKFPVSRIDEVLKTVKPCVIITDEEHYQDVSSSFGKDYKIMLFNEMLTNDADNSLLKNRREKMFDMQPLYINFTSGSTGKPKGVAVGHRSVIDFISCFVEIFGITEEDSIMNQAPFDFDVSVKDIYSCLFTGATVHIVPTEFFMQPINLIDYICDKNATVLIWAVSALCFITSMNCLTYRIPETLKTIMFSGEVMPIKHLNKLKKYLPDVKYVNLYGPTEITCNCTYYVVDRDYSVGEKLPIGIPFPNERIYILDENDQIVTAPGNQGELCVGGTALALGYYRNKEKTDEVFIQNPNNKDYVEMIYRTGDIVEIKDDMQVYYSSRKDSQIKHLGHRVELSEIELAIEATDKVNRACCYFDDAKDKIIAVYIGDATKDEIIDRLNDVLPYYMIPNSIYKSSFTTVPMNKNGKVDRKVLYQDYCDNEK